MAVAGVYLLTDVVLAGEPLGVAVRRRQRRAVRALHHPRRAGGRARGRRRHRRPRGVDADRRRGRHAARRAGRCSRCSRTRSRSRPAIGVGVSSSVIPYVSDQLALARMKRVDLRADGLAAAGHRDGDRDRRARAAAHRRRGGGRRARRPRASRSTASATRSSNERHAPRAHQKRPQPFITSLPSVLNPNEPPFVSGKPSTVEVLDAAAAVAVATSSRWCRPRRRVRSRCRP